jgi:hypothetical protein
MAFARACDILSGGVHSIEAKFTETSFVIHE